MELQLDAVENMNNTFRENPQFKNLIEKYFSLISWLYNLNKIIEEAQDSGINTGQSDGLPFIKKILSVYIVKLERQYSYATGCRQITR